jgi:hypothetical protein
MSPGFVFDGTFQLINRLTKLPMDWPVGTGTRFRISWGTGTELLIAGTVDGSYLRFHMTGAQTELVPRRSMMVIDINYDSGNPLLWRPWRAGRVGPCH